MLFLSYFGTALCGMVSLKYPRQATLGKSQRRQNILLGIISLQLAVLHILLAMLQIHTS